MTDASGNGTFEHSPHCQEKLPNDAPTVAPAGCSGRMVIGAP
jgi:hypothetical protein